MRERWQTSGRGGCGHQRDSCVAIFLYIRLFYERQFLRAPNVRSSPLVESLTPLRNECLFMVFLFQLCFSGRCIICFSLKLIEALFLNHQLILLVGPHHNFGEYVQNFLRTKVHSTQWLKWIFSLYTLNDRKLFLPGVMSPTNKRCRWKRSYMSL